MDFYSIIIHGQTHTLKATVIIFMKIRKVLSNFLILFSNFQIVSFYLKNFFFHFLIKTKFNFRNYHEANRQSVFLFSIFLNKNHKNQVWIMELME